eukprot:364443-Chlamydomonas_euryale.AAC.20
MHEHTRYILPPPRLPLSSPCSGALICMTAGIEPLVSSTARVGAEEVEYFEVLDEQGRGTGRRELRAVVHATGLFHRAVYCFVFDTAGRLLIQRRHADKKVGPEQWDLSVAEHLLPGECYAAAVVRGLQEELGIEVSRDAIKGPLTPAHKRSLHLPDIGVTDNEVRLHVWCLGRKHREGQAVVLAISHVMTA